MFLFHVNVSLPLFLLPFPSDTDCGVRGKACSSPGPGEVTHTREQALGTLQAAVKGLAAAKP